MAGAQHLLDRRPSERLRGSRMTEAGFRALILGHGDDRDAITRREAHHRLGIAIGLMADVERERENVCSDGHRWALRQTTGRYTCIDCFDELPACARVEPRQTWQEAVRTSGMTEEQQARLLAMQAEDEGAMKADAAIRAARAPGYVHPSEHSHHLATGPDVAGTARTGWSEDRTHELMTRDYAREGQVPGYARVEADDENEQRGTDCLERDEAPGCDRCDGNGDGCCEPE